MTIDSAVAKPVATDDKNWYAIQTRSRHEAKAEKYLRAQGITTFLPMVSEVHRWSDRRKVVESPLFVGYAFVRVSASPEDRIKVLRTQGVVDIVSTRGVGIPIPEDQIEGVRAIVSNNLPFTDHHFLKVGQRVRINGGSLDGLEGILVSQNGYRNLVISVDAIQRSLSIQIEGYRVEPA